MKKTLILLAVIVGFIVYIVFFRGSPIERLIDRGVECLAQENTEGFMELISREFRSEDGTVYDDVPEILSAVFDVFDHIKVIVEEQETHREEDGNHARVTLKFKALANVDEQRGYVAGGPMNTETLRIRVRKENDGWKFLSTDRYRVSKEELKNIRELF